MYKIEIAPQAAKILEKIYRSDRVLYGRLIRVIEDLAEHPFIGKQLKADLKGSWSVRVGNYRIIYKVMQSRLTVQVIDVGHRKDIYKSN